MRFPIDRFECVEQVGGIQTAVLDNGPARGQRIAMVNTGAGLRYTVALDRAADLVHAHHHAHSLAYLTQNRIKAPSHAYHHADGWLDGWPGGMVTTCGPQQFGDPRREQGVDRPLHGHFSNQPAQVTELINPDPHLGQMAMRIGAIVRDTRGYGPNLETRREISSTLGENAIHLVDHTINRDPYRNLFGMLYHVNLGWPLLDAGSRLILRGTIQPWSDAAQLAVLPDEPNGYKQILAPHASFVGERSRGLICTPQPDGDGLARVGIANPRIDLALEIAFEVAQLPRLMVWQHLGPGMYVCGLEPMVGTPSGSAREPGHVAHLDPGQTRTTAITLRVHTDAGALDGHDGDLALETA
ncbi:MAG: DUF4432 family protein [Planctomycetes bacterium]|jgi:hypothetical protein|nr:DUF4432 family protein [Planctomycetota bacterium]